MSNKYKVVAILDRSAGNDSVGDMWQETAIFTEESTLKEVLDWAQIRSNSAYVVDPGERSRLTNRLQITTGEDITKGETNE